MNLRIDDLKDAEEEEEKEHLKIVKIMQIHTSRYLPVNSIQNTLSARDELDFSYYDAVSSFRSIY